MAPAHDCHVPSGVSFNQFLHYGLEIKYGYFGKYKVGPEVPPNFNLSNIIAPLSLHCSSYDTLADPDDVDRLISELGNVSSVQKINETYSHVDFMWSKNNPTILYPLIIDFLNKY